MIQLVVFDMAGTTVNNTFGVHDCLIKAFSSHRFNIDRSLANLSIAVPKPIGIAAILNRISSDTHFPEVIENIHQSFIREMKLFYSKNDSVSELKGTLEAFSYLKNRGIKIGIDTGFDRETAQVIIDRLGWERLEKIDASCTSDEVENGRPAPDMILQLMLKTQVKHTQQVVKVGDTPADIRQGKNAGCSGIIAINSGAFDFKNLTAESPDYIIPDQSEFIVTFEKLEQDIKTRFRSETSKSPT